MLTLCYRYSEWVCVCCYLLECWLCLAQRQRGRDWQAQLHLLLVRAKLLREASGSGNDPLEGATSIHNLQSEWQLFLKDSMYEGRWTVILPFSPLWITGDGLRGDESRALWNWWMVKICICRTLGNGYVKLSRMKRWFTAWNKRKIHQYTCSKYTHCFWQFTNFKFKNSVFEFYFSKKGWPNDTILCAPVPPRQFNFTCIYIIFSQSL